MAVAESSAGGAISTALLGVSGASRFFADGVVVYSKGSKARLLGLSDAQQAEARSATEEHALMLARAARRVCVGDWGVAETGVAGPGPSGRGSPPGLCCVAVVGPGGFERARTLQSGTAVRVDNLRAFARGALQLLADSVGAGAGAGADK